MSEWSDEQQLQIQLFNLTNVHIYYVYMICNCAFCITYVNKSVH